MTETTRTAAEIRAELAIAVRAEEAAKRATAVRTALVWDKQYDKYRRPCVGLRRQLFDAAGQLVAVDWDIAVVVTLPKHYAETYGDRYLVNVRGKGEDGRGLVTYHRSRKVALATAEASI